VDNFGSNEPIGSSDESGIRDYSDVISRGGLHDALVSIANEVQVDLGDADDRTGSVSREWNVAKFSSSRGNMRINLGRGRRFAVNLDSGWGHVWASGSTSNIVEVVEVLALWRRGARLKELGNRFPFMKFDRLSQAYEDGNPVETQWDILIGDDEFITYRNLLLRLHDNSNLRKMFPFFSHWKLRMAKDCYDAQAGEIIIRPSGSEGYIVWASSAPMQKIEIHRLDDLIDVANAMLRGL